MLKTFYAADNNSSTYQCIQWPHTNLLQVDHVDVEEDLVAESGHRVVAQLQGLDPVGAGEHGDGGQGGALQHGEWCQNHNNMKRRHFTDN